MAPPVIRTRNLCRSFQMKGFVLEVLKGVDLDIHCGEYVAIMGPSGSGKSTLMNLLACLDSPTDGTYELDGMEVADLSDRELAQVRNKKIGIVFQSFNLLPRYTALRNTELPLMYADMSPRDRKRRALEVLDDVGLSDRVNHRPNELSGGQQQRVAIARALVTEPAVLFADEPTGNLDSKSSEEIIDLFDSLNHDRGVTVVVITHDAGVALHASRVVLLRDGEVVEDSTPDAAIIRRVLSGSDPRSITSKVATGRFLQETQVMPPAGRTEAASAVAVATPLPVTPAEALPPLPDARRTEEAGAQDLPDMREHGDDGNGTGDDHGDNTGDSASGNPADSPQ